MVAARGPNARPQIRWGEHGSGLGTGVGFSYWAGLNRVGSAGMWDHDGWAQTSEATPPWTVDLLPSARRCGGSAGYGLESVCRAGFASRIGVYPLFLLQKKNHTTISSSKEKSQKPSKLWRVQNSWMENGPFSRARLELVQGARTA